MSSRDDFSSPNVRNQSDAKWEKEIKRKLGVLITLDSGERSKKKYNTISANHRSTIKIVDKASEESNRDL